MKQIITIRRTELRTIELEVPQALTGATLTAEVNSALRGVGAPGFGRVTRHEVGSWAVTKAEPSGDAPQRRGGKTRRGH